MQKFESLIAKDRSTQRNLLVILVIVCIAGLLWHTLKLQQQKLKIVEEKARLASRVSALEQDLKAKEEQVRKAEVLLAQKNESRAPSTAYALKGIYIQDNDKYSVINDDVYREGDRLNECVVAQITPSTVILQEPVTGKTITLILHEEDSAQ